MRFPAIKSRSLTFFITVILVAIAIASLLRSHVAVARRVQESVAVQHPLEAKTELVKLDVSVLDKQGKFVGGLEQESFRVVDNGAERPIVFFTPVEAPARVVVMLETSPAVYMIQDEHIAAAYALLNGLAQDDQVALVTYSDSPRQLLPFTTDKAALLNALGNNQYMIGMAALNLYDSTAAVVNGITPMPGKKAVVLLTTGIDSSGPERFDTLVQKLRTQDVVIFAVGLGGSLNNTPVKKPKGAKKSKANQDDSDSSGPGTFEKARAALQSLATMTGGRAYFPESGNDFGLAYQEIASALRHQYVLGIVPQHDGQFHKLTVSVADAAGASSQSREGAHEKSRDKSHGKSHDRTEYSVSARDGYTAPGP